MNNSFEMYSNNRQVNTIHENIYDPVARIIVMGVGGAGNNAINRMIDDGVKGVEFVGINTDAQDLRHCRASKRISIGEKITGGRGCGAIPEIGESAANESKEAIRALLRETETQKKADMVFITCGMGGGTGTGAAPIIAAIAKEEGILTVAVVTKPFRFEGKVRMNRALAGINKLYPNVDTLISISNDKLLEIVDVKDGFKESFAKADEILKQSIRGITDLINLPALINLDFADVSTVMRGKGLAHIAVGEGSGENKVLDAMKKAMESPLLDTTIDGATDLIVSMSGEVSLKDVDAAMKVIEPKLYEDVNIIFGAREDANLKNSVSITLIATGIKSMSNTFNTYGRMSSNYGYGYGGFQNNQSINKEPSINKDNIESAMSMPQYDNGIKETANDIVSSFFNNKKKEENKDFQTNKNMNNSSISPDNLNVDLSRIGFSKKEGNSKNLLPSFITDNLNKK